jgi:hypothetical protein
MPKYYDRDKVTIVPGDPEAIWDPELSCPSNLTPPGGGHDEEALRGMMAEAEQQADSTQTLINMLRDAGDTGIALGCKHERALAKRGGLQRTDVSFTLCK